MGEVSRLGARRDTSRRGYRQAERQGRRKTVIRMLGDERSDNSLGEEDKG